MSGQAIRTHNLLIGYLKDLVTKWYLVAITVFDILGMLIQPFLPFDIPIWAYLSIFGAAFIYANYALYSEGRRELSELTKRHELETAGLKDRIAELEDRLPILDLLFQTEGGFARHATIQVQDLPSKPDFDELVRAEAAQFVPLPEEETESSSPNSLQRFAETMWGAFQTTRKSPDEHKKEWDSYLEEYERYLIERYNYEVYAARYRSLRFAVQNSGRVPAEDIVVIAHFPDGFLFPSAEERLLEHQREPPSPPRRPSPYTSWIDRFPRVTPGGYPTFGGDIVSDLGGIGPSNASGPFIKPGNSTEVSYEVQKLLHDFVEVDLDEVEFAVLDDAIGHTWEVRYSIHAANLPQPQQGSLFLEVQLDEGPRDEPEHDDETR